MTHRPLAHPALVAAALATCVAAALAPPALAQTTTNPFPNAIPKGDIVVQVGDYVTLPPSNGAPARMNSSAVSPDGRFFVLDQRGPVYTVTPPSVMSGTVTPASATQYLNLDNYNLNLLNDNGERGAAEIAFHPQFNQRGTDGYGKLYASFSASTISPTTPAPDFQIGNLNSHDEVVYEFKTTTPSAPTFTQEPGVNPRQVLRIREPQGNHNGGGLGFNPTAAPGTPDYGALYYSSGDGGGGGDPYNSGQSPNTPFGSILRINPMGTDGVGRDHGTLTGAGGNALANDPTSANTLAENYATGFRNPQRFSWDPATGKMYVGDIGQGTIEEVDVVTNGANYGWNLREGSYSYINGSVSTSPAPADPALTNPIAEYDHSNGLQAVTGGFVYRGTAIPELEGMYVFGDLVHGNVFYIDADAASGSGQDIIRELRLTEDMGATEKSLLQLINEPPDITTGRADLRLGQDALGNLYLLNKHDGIVRALLPQVVPEPATATVLLGGGLLLLRRRRRAG